MRDTPRVYRIEDEEGKRHQAYRIVASMGEPGEYWGVQGMTWRDPPILANPDRIRRENGRELLLFYDGSKLRMVGWKTPRARVLGVEHARPQDLEFAPDRDGSVAAATELVEGATPQDSAGPTGNTPVNGAPSARLNARPRKLRRRRRPSRRAAQSERSVLAQRPQHLRHERRGLVPELPLRNPLVRRLPRGGGRAQRRHVLHRPALLVPVALVQLREALGRGAAQQGGRGDLGHQPAPDEPRAVAVRALGQAVAAGRGDALCPPADGRRRARGGRSEGAVARRPVDLRERAARRGALRRPLQGQGDLPAS